MFCQLLRLDNHGYLQRESLLSSLAVFYVFVLPVIISGASRTMGNKNGGTFDLVITSEGKLSVFHHGGRCYLQVFFACLFSLWMLFIE